MNISELGLSAQIASFSGPSLGVANAAGCSPPL